MVTENKALIIQFFNNKNKKTFFHNQKELKFL